MERIASFQVDHIRLNRGLYVSRIDEINGNYLTSFDIRMKLPNREPVINIAELHTMEHLGATFLRNHEETNFENFNTASLEQLNFQIEQVKYLKSNSYISAYKAINSEFSPIEKEKN